jgi:hypothetical protein
MTRPNLIISTRIASEDVDTSSLFNTTSLDNFELDFQSALDAIDGGPVGAALDADPTGIQATRVTWGNATNGAILTGTGLQQVNNLDALEASLENGIATGAFDTLRIISGGQTILSLNFAAAAITLTSGAQSLRFAGILPTSLQDIFDFLGQLVNAAEGADLRTAAAVLADFDLSSLTLTDNGVTVFNGTLGNTGLVVTLAGGAEFRVDGQVPATSIGTLVSLIADIDDLENTAAGFNNLGQLPGLAINAISLKAADGSSLIRTTGPIQEVNPPFANIVLEGTDGSDLGIYAGYTTAETQAVLLQLGNGRDSAVVDANDFFFGDAAPVMIDGGAFFNDSIEFSDFRSNSTEIDFAAGTIRGFLTGEDQARYTVNFTNIEIMETDTDRNLRVLGGQDYDTLRPGQAFSDIEFSGGAAIDQLDLSNVVRSDTGGRGLTVNDLGGFSAVYTANAGLRLTHDSVRAQITLVDVERVVLGDGTGGTVNLSLDEVVDASRSAVDFVIGTSASDVLSGDRGANTILGQSGNDVIYGDGLEANLTGAAAGQAYRMYQATLDRAPDAGGYEGWVSRLYEGKFNVSQMAGGFVASTEFQNTYGSLGNPAFVDQLYQNVLDRSGTQAEITGWLTAMNNGRSRADVVVGFSESTEFQNTTRAEARAFAESQSEAVWTDEIYRVYRATLDRDPDQAGFLGWAERLGDGRAYNDMIGGFVGSVEFQNTYGSLGNAAFVNLLYRNVLDREADAGGLQGWLDVLDAGGSRAQVVRGFSDSVEFIRDTAADLKAWVKAQGVQDTIVGGAGSNKLTGGLLSDVFVFEASQPTQTTITDFEAWDALSFNGYALNSFTDFEALASQQGADTVVPIGTDFYLRLQNVQLDMITADQVQFFSL